MLDFNTKKRILQNLRAKRSKNKLMWLSCVIAEAFVKLWYAFLCTIDMALSDSRGNFLGVKREKRAKKIRRQDDIVYVKKPFWGRMLSAVLACSFIFMMVPEVDFTVSAAISTVITATDENGNTLNFYRKPGSDDIVYLQSDYDRASGYEMKSINYQLAYGNISMNWKIQDGISTKDIDGYSISLYELNSGKYFNDADKGSINETIFQGTQTEYVFIGGSTTATYKAIIAPVTEISEWKYEEPLVEGDPGTVTKLNSTVAIEGVALEKEIGIANATFEKPVLDDIEDDSSVITWKPVLQKGGDAADVGTPADGYIVYRRINDLETGKTTNYEKIADVKSDQLQDGKMFLDVKNSSKFPTKPGTHYEFFVEAYRSVWDGPDYNAKNPGLISSSGSKVAATPDEKVGAYEIKDLFTTPAVPLLSLTPNDKKHTIDVSWEVRNGSCSGVLLYRSERQITSDEAIEKGAASLTDYIMNLYENGTAGLVRIGSFPASQTSCEDKTIVEGKTYWYYPIAFLTKDKDDYNARLYSGTDGYDSSLSLKLGTPQGFIATPGDGKVDLKWNAVSGADGYMIYITKLSSHDGNWVGLGALDPIDVGKTTSYSHIGLFNGDRYSYWVRAYIDTPSDNTEDPTKYFGNFSDKRTVTVGIDLTIPQDLEAETEDGMISVSWSDVKGAEGYILYYKMYGASAWSKIELSKTEFDHTGLLNGATYSYYVKAYKTVNGVRVYSDDSVTITMVVGDILDTPKDFAAVTTDGKVDLSWTASKGAEGYILYAHCDGKTYQFDVSKVKYQHANLENGQVWTYYLVAYKTVNGKRTYSDPTKSITVTIGVSLNAALDLTATAGNRQIDLTWTEVKGAEGYVVYLYDEDTMEFEAITVTSKVKYSHIGLKNGKEYTYMVAPFKTINGKRFYGDYSMAVSAIPTTGSITDMDRTLNIKGTTPYGISHSEYIAATANHGAFDESVDVYFTTNKESTAAVKDVIKGYANGLKSFIIYPFDISIYQENTLVDVMPNDGYTVTVTMPIPDKLIAYRDYITVVHINEEAGAEYVEQTEWYEISDQRLEVLPCAILDIDNVWCVQFVCSSFSPYAFVIYKDHINDVSSGGGVADGTFAGNFNSGMLLFTALPDIMPHNRKLKVVSGGSKKYHIKKIEKK